MERLHLMRHHQRRCRETRALMSDYLDGELDADARRRIERHARFCPECRRMLRSLRRTIDGLARLSEHEPPTR